MLKTKRMAAGLLIAAMMMLGAACGGPPNPEIMVNAMLTDLRDGGVQALAAHAEDPDDMELAEDDMWVEISAAITAQLDWEIERSQIAPDGNTATVTVHISAPNMPYAMAEIVAEAIARVFSEPDFDMESYMQTALTARLADEGDDALPRVEATVDIHLTLADGNRWVLARGDANDAFANAVLGNLLDAFDEGPGDDAGEAAE